MIGVFTPERISSDFPFKSNQRLVKISILTLWCAFWLRGEMHTEEFFENFSSLDSAVWCTPRSLTLRWDAHRRVFLKFKYLSEIETGFENTLAWLSGAQMMGSNQEKNWRSKISWHIPFNDKMICHV